MMCVGVVWVAQGSAPNPDATVVYSSDRAFADLLKGSLSMNKAILTGKLKVPKLLLHCHANT